MRTESGRWAWVEIDLEAVAHNLAEVASRVGPAEIWAVVKADAYGHGAVAVARAAIEAGARGLCVALVSEAEQLRAAGITVPILLLSQQPPEVIPRLVAARAIPTVDTPEFVDLLAAALTEGDEYEIHLKVDTGMQRVGATPGQLPAVLAAIRRAGSRLRIGAVFTHLATADDLDDVGVVQQVRTFHGVLDGLRRTEADLCAGAKVHIANSAAALGFGDLRADVVRLGIAMYGISPGPRIDSLLTPAGDLSLRPVMRLAARVSHIKAVRAGSGISYGWRHRFATDTTVATVPLGYADGVPRGLGLAGGEVLIAGTRCPIRGVVTMDQLMVEVGHLDEGQVAVGSEVVLIGPQGSEEITATEWAGLMDTIPYEVVCGISARMERIIRPRVGG